MRKIEFRYGRVIDPKNGIDQQASVFVAEGKIIAVGTTPLGFLADEVIDVSNKWIIPGLVDLSARPFPFSGELKAAIAGGITHIVCPPDARPPLDEPGLVEQLVSKASSYALSKVYPLGALTKGLKGEQLAEMASLRMAGCIGFSQAAEPLPNFQSLYRALQYAATFDLPVWLRPLESSLASLGSAHDGATASRLGLPAQPSCAETIAIAALIELAHATGARIHVTRVSSGRGAKLIEAARLSGLPISTDVAIHQLHLNEQDTEFFNTNARLDPPLRSAIDQCMLGDAIERGAIQAICSDHTPLAKDAKMIPFGESTPGASGIELLLPLALEWGTLRGIPPARVISTLTCGPAQIAGLDAGHLTPGARADLCIFNPDSRWIISAEELLSTGKNTPFIGKTINGQVDTTMVDGCTVFDRFKPLK